MAWESHRDLGNAPFLCTDITSRNPYLPPLTKPSSLLNSLPPPPKYPVSYTHMRCASYHAQSSSSKLTYTYCVTNTFPNFFFALFYVCKLNLWAAIAQSVQRLATGWTVRGSNPGGGEIFRTCPERTWGPNSLLHNGYLVSFPGTKRPGRGFEHPSHL
jgi:hypothetical protein